MAGIDSQPDVYLVIGGEGNIQRKLVLRYEVCLKSSSRQALSDMLYCWTYTGDMEIPFVYIHLQELEDFIPITGPGFEATSTLQNHCELS